MLRTCESFVAEFNVLLNGSKSVLVVTGSNHQNINVELYLNNNLNEQREHTVHMGTIIGHNSTPENVKKTISDLYNAPNTLMSKFGHCSSDALIYLCNAYCTFFYGSLLWNLSHVDRLEIAWWKCIKKT